MAYFDDPIVIINVKWFNALSATAKAPARTQLMSSLGCLNGRKQRDARLVRLSPDGPSDRFAAGVGGVDCEGPAVGAGDLERVVDAAAADLRGQQSLSGVVAVRGIDVVDHQVEGGSGPGGGRRLGVPDPDVSAPAQVEDG